MALRFVTSHAPATGAAAIAKLLDEMRLAGWTCPVRSTGLGGIVAEDGLFPTADDMGNPGAWVVVQQPPGGAAPYAGARQWAFQRDPYYAYTGSGNNGNNYTWLIAVSFDAGFTTNKLQAGTTTKLPVPPPDNRAILCGSWDWNQAGYPSGAQIFQGDGTYRIHTIVNPLSPFQWMLLSFPGAQGGVVTLLGQDGLSNYLSGDPDPYVYFVNWQSNGSCLASTSLFRDDWYWKAWLKKGDIGADFISVGAMAYSTNSGSVFPEGASTDPENGQDNLVPLSWARHVSRGNPCGWKGTSSLFMWASPSRPLGDTLNVGGQPANYLRAGAVAIPWDGSVPLL